ncbi:Aste57867_16300 [Aphanomyces stellatus]|uniref:Aste57867_16300 protein n=1 Tax=Aphanomyces stellatus TaxID=120398 RepID=A0A485L5C8_9STRA|nr:hypothetical protein As57867_016243 [Aphanomyces stellatus]VFT93076.1 Aste57867_16300 [Aphanomyces stellatus]
MKQHEDGPTAEDIIHAAVALKWEERNRSMVEYRKKKKMERVQLRETIAELERTKKAMPAKKALACMLSWKDVAKALQEGRRMAEIQQTDLKRRVDDHEALVREMQRWVLASHIEIAPNPAQRSWRNVTLLANPTSRQLGKEWICKQMHHNMERMFDQHGFPALDALETIDWELNFTFSDQGFTSVYRRQLSRDITMEASMDYIRRTLLSVQVFIAHYSPRLHKEIYDIQGQTQQVALVTPRQDFVNILCGEFITHDQYVLVVQQIHDDESCTREPTHRQRNRTSWHDIRRLPNGRTMWRILALQSQSFTSTGRVIQLREDAQDYGVDLTDCPDHLLEARFPRLFRNELTRRLQQATPLIQR